MAQEAALVAQRCMEAQGSGVVNLSKCGLMAVPDALYLFLKNSNVTKVDLSENQLKRIPSKLANAFPQIEELNLSNNMEVCSLPDEFSNCQNLFVLNLAGNTFAQLPSFISSLQSLQVLDLSNNVLETLSDSDITSLASIKSVRLEQNSLSDDIKVKLKEYSNFVV